MPFTRPELVVVTVAEACKMLGLSRTTLSRMRRDNIGPKPVKLSARRIGYRLDDIMAYLAQGVGLGSPAAAAA